MHTTWRADGKMGKSDEAWIAGGHKGRRDWLVGGPRWCYGDGTVDESGINGWHPRSGWVRSDADWIASTLTAFKCSRCVATTQSYLSADKMGGEEVTAPASCRVR